MIHSLYGKLLVKKPDFAVVEANGIGFKARISSKTSRSLGKTGSKTRLFCELVISQAGADLYGFPNEKELEIFNLLNTVNGIGPKSALEILGGFGIEKLAAVINKGRADILSKSWGIGRKKAERIILELKGKIKAKTEDDLPELMESDKDLEAALKNLGYVKDDIKEAIKNLPSKIKKIEERLKLALKFLNRK